MTRRRITIEGEWERAAGEWVLVVPCSDGTTRILASIDDAVDATVEVIPGPLPTEPGTAFRARYKDEQPTTWFMYRRGDFTGYISANGTIVTSDARHLVRVAVES